ncbi:Creatinase/aminopeptidase [Atractiella rhizophila]|nr:Creatinase/aminopeptidase [Atractiella rhizophila]
MQESGEKLRVQDPKTSSKRGRLLLTVILGLCVLYTYAAQIFPLRASGNVASPDFSHLASICSSLQPVSLSEFTSRRDDLVSILQKTSSTSATSYKLPLYLAEPSPNTLYYFNITPSSWGLSERPFISIVLPSFSVEEGDKSQLAVLSPAFEVSRAQRLPWARADSETVTFVPWKDDEVSYDVLMDWLVTSAQKHSGGNDIEIVLQPDENVRNFVLHGLEAAASKYSKKNLSISIQFVAQEVREQRMRKSPAELELLRCAEKATLASIREVRKLLKVGMTELEAEALILSALRAAGLTNPAAIVLFGENAALPHASAGTKKLEEGEFALFDLWGPLHGYYSDLTRTVLPPSVPVGKRPSKEQETVWKLVQRAQQKAVEILEQEGVTAAQVDRAARGVIEEQGLGEYFTHRVGHGIGLEVHEAPFLTSANKDVSLLAGETFSDEPGVYIEGYLGVRLEDTILKTDNGYEILSGGFAVSPWEP